MVTITQMSRKKEQYPQNGYYEILVKGKKKILGSSID